MASPLRRLFRLATGRPAPEHEIDDELELHLSLAEDELVAQGVDRVEARRRARAAFGDARRIRAALVRMDRKRDRAASRGESWHKWRTDVRLALRGLRRDPWFAIAGITLVALAIGANTAVLSVVNAAFYRPLPYPDAARLVAVAEAQGGGAMRVAGPNFRDWTLRSTSFAGIAATNSYDAVVVDGGTATRARGAMVTRSFADVVGVVPIAGRWFAREEASAGGAAVVVLGERLWRERLGGDPAVLGRSIQVDGQPVVVVGVMPRRLDYPVGADLWLPAEPSLTGSSRTAHNWSVVGRLIRRTSPEEATRELSLLTRQILADQPAADREFLADGALVTPLRQALLGQSPRLLLMLQAAVAMLLVIAVLNLITLQLARAARRGPEMSTIVALGAGGRDLARRFVAESLVLSVVGGAVGLGLWQAGRGPLTVLVGSVLPFVRELPMDGRMAGAIAGLMLLVALTAGLVPAWWAARSVRPGAGIGHGGRVVGPGRLMRALIGAEVAATFVLLFGAALLGESLRRMLDQPLGFEPTGRVAMSVPLSSDDGSPYRNPDRFRLFFDDLTARVRAIPGVEAVGVTSAMPLLGYSPNGSARIMGESSGAGGPPSVSDFRVAGPGFFGALGIPLLAGRDFTFSDDQSSPYVVVVSAAFAKTHLRGESPLGRQVRFPGMDDQGEDRWATVVGVVGDTRHDGPGSRSEPAVYYTYRQRPPVGRTMTVVVRVRGPEGAVLGAMRQVLTDAEASVPFDGGRLTGALASVVSTPKIRAVVVGIFAAAALTLAGFGLFGVVGFVVLRRARELGLRLALGAPARAIVRVTVSEALVPVAAGLGVGIAVALMAARLLRGFLFELSPADPELVAESAALVLVVALAASIAPTRRALRIDPAESLRR